MVYSTERSKAVVPVLLLCGLFYEAICLHLPCVNLFLYFSVLLAFRLPRLGKRELILVLFVSVRFAIAWFCLFPLPLRVWDGLRFMTVAFSLIPFYKNNSVCFIGLRVQITSTGFQKNLNVNILIKQQQ